MEISSEAKVLAGQTSLKSGVGNGAFQSRSSSRQPPNSEVEVKKTVEDRVSEVKSSRLLLGGVAGLAGLAGFAFKDGLDNGFEKIGKTAESLSNVVSVPFSILFPFVTLKNEYDNLKGKTKTEDDNLLNRMVYSCASVGFAPQTFAEPILAFTKGGLHKLATIANLPHLLFTLFSYTGGRAMGAITTFRRAFTKDETQKYRLEQEFNSLYNLGNIGSAHASVCVMSENFADGWKTLGDIFTGDFASAYERFREKPLAIGLGTIFNSWLFPAEWAAKFFDTSIRCAENVDNFRNAIGNNSIIVKALNKYKNFWAENSNNRDSLLGKILYHGREFAKVESLLVPPIGMATVVLPSYDKFLRGDFFNKEAQAIGGSIGFFDKVTSAIAFFGHTFHTGLYGLTIRLPQTITTATFYLTSLRNKIKGVKHGDKGYVDAIDVRDKIFNRKLLNKLSNWAEGKLNKIEDELHGSKANKVNPVTKESKYIRNYTTIMAQEVVYEQIKEKYFSRMVEELNGVKPGQKEWGEYLNNNKVQILEEFEPKLEKYYRKSEVFDDSQISYMKSGKGKEYWNNIISSAKEMLDQEISTCLSSDESKEEKHTPNNVKLPDTFLGLLSNPKALLEVAKLRTFHVTNSILPMFVKGFVNVVDFGKKDDPFWLRNHLAQKTGIAEGDLRQATDREACPVFWLNFQNAGKGAAKFYNAIGSLFGMAA